MNEQQINNIPLELRELKQWVCYVLKPRDNGKIGKPPASPSTGNLISWNDPKNFLSFDQAIKHLKANKPGNLAGIGIVFTGGEPFSGIDIDDCIDAGGKPKPGIQDIIDRMGSYTELSPSGKGIRIIGIGKLPDGDNGGKHGSYEAYSAARFLTITGNVFENRNTIRDFTYDLAWFRQTYATAPTKATPPRDHQDTRQSSGALSDDDIMKIIGRAKNGAKIQNLMNNQTKSEDLAKLVNCLAFYTKDSGQIERIIRAGCHARDKWNEKRGENNFLAYEIKRLLARYQGGSFEPQSRSEIERSPLPEMKPGEDPRKIYNPNRTTDMGNSERLFELAGKDIRYVKEMGWHVWRDGRWAHDEMALREIFKKVVVAKLYQELSEKALTHDQAGVKELSSWAKRSEAERQIHGGLSMAASMEGIYIQPSALDRDPWLLNVKNGTIDLRTGALREHRREDIFTKICPVSYDPTAKAPVWEAFLMKVMGGKADLVNFLKRAVGYSITGSVQAQCWFIAHGVGANGKGTFLNTILGMLGDYATQAAPDLLMMAKGDASRHPTEQADLFGKRLAVCQETEEGRRLAEVAVKQMTGGDRIKARLMRKDFFEFDPTHKLWLATNHKPVIRDTTESTWRRIHMIPFGVVIPKEERDELLIEKLKAELPGILAWSVAGCLEWQRVGLNPPAEVTESTQSYRESQDILSAFLAECCVVPQSARWAAKTTASNLYQAYSEWIKSAGEHPKSQRVFGEALTERGFQKVRTKTGYAYLGISLVVDGEPCEPCEPKSGMSHTETSYEGLIPESGSSPYTRFTKSDDEDII